MLSSQIASVSQPSISSALLQSSITSSTAMLRSSGSLPRRSHSHHQIRTLRIGLWSSYLDPDFQKEVQRRHRIMKHKYIEAVNRRLSWERRHSVSSRQTGFKGFMCSAWREQDTRPGGRWVDMDELNNTKDGREAPSRGIEDVEQSAFDKLLDHKDGLYDRVRARSRTWFMSAESAINPLSGSSTVVENTPRRAAYDQDEFRQRFQRFQNRQTPEPEPEYEIDPITNRKVVKNKSSESSRKPINVPVNTFKGYRSQFQHFTPPALQSTESDLKTYKPLNVSDKSIADDGKHSDSARESLKDYDGDRKYKPFFRYEPDGQKPESKTESLNEYDRKISYESSQWYPESKSRGEKTQENSCPVQEALSDYDKKVVYGPLMYREPDGQLPETPCPVQKGLQDYDGKVTYGPVMYNEPDGQPPPERDTVAEGLRDFDSRAEYAPRRILKNISLNFGSGKPDRSFRYSNEDTREDLDLLRPSDIRAASGIIKGGKKETEEEKQAVRTKLEDDFQQQQDLMEKLSIETSELRNHTAHLQGRIEAKLAEDAGELPSKPTQRKLTGNFVRDFPEDFETKWTPEKESGSLKPENESSGKNFQETFPKESYARRPNVPRIETSLDRTSESPRNNKRVERVERPYSVIDQIFKGPQGTEMRYTEELKYEHERDPYTKTPMGLETNFAEEIAKERALELERDPYSKVPQGLETSYMTEQSHQRRLEIEKDPYSKVPQGLETSFVEEVKLQNEKDPYSKKPMGLETSFVEEVKLENEKDPYSKKPMGLETSFLEEVKLENEKDPYSKKPMGLETNFAEEIAGQQAEGDLSARVSSFGNRSNTLVNDQTNQSIINEKRNAHKALVRQIRQIYEAKYGTLDSKHRQVPEPSAASETVISSDNIPEQPNAEDQEPTVYKILAYDPTMQEINIAETSSIVPDSASALTPAEVLLRISNPAKFFPHFQPLQSQGYEIVSGSGDVLVFRKVRSAGLQRSKSETASSIQERQKTTNPIDGMQSSPVAATGNFASPTGFVNHDLPVSDPPFKSNIDVRREEPVFSGKSTWQDNSKSTKRKSTGRGKRLLIGAAWVAGCSYAIGVVTEFFRTGGVDGLGSKNF